MALRTIAIAAGLSLAAASPALAQNAPFPVIPNSEVFSAYQAICLAQPSDTAAQIAAATAAPYGMTLVETAEDGSKRFKNDRMFAAMLKSKEYQFCMVAGNIGSDATVQSASALAEPVLSRKGQRVAESETQVIWSDVNVKPVTIYMYMHSNVDGTVIGSYLTGVEQPK